MLNMSTRHFFHLWSGSSTSLLMLRTKFRNLEAVLLTNLTSNVCSVNTEMKLCKQIKVAKQTKLGMLKARAADLGTGGWT